MKAILEFNLPEDQDDMDYALAGLDALLVINDLENEIRNKLRYNAGDFVNSCDDTLEKVWNVLIRFKQERNLPELT